MWVDGFWRVSGQANYSAAKGGVLGMTKAMAKEFAPSGVTGLSLSSLSSLSLSLSLSLSPFLSLLSVLFLRAYQKARQLCHNRVLLALNTSVPLIYCSRPASSFVLPLPFCFLSRSSQACLSSDGPLFMCLWCCSLPQALYCAGA